MASINSAENKAVRLADARVMRELREMKEKLAAIFEEDERALDELVEQFDQCPGLSDVWGEVYRLCGDDSDIESDEEWEALEKEGLIHGALLPVVGGYRVQAGSPTEPEWVGLSEVDGGYLVRFTSNNGTSAWFEPTLGGLLFRMGTQFMQFARELEVRLDAWAADNKRKAFDDVGALQGE